MAEPLSIAGSAVGIVSLGLTVVQSLIQFYSSYKNQDSELKHMVMNLESLGITFSLIDKDLLDRKFQVQERGTVDKVENLIEECNEFIQELKEECSRLKQSASGTKGAISKAGKRLAYPFRKSTLEKLNENIGEIRANVSTALDALQLRDSTAIRDDVADSRLLLDLIRTNQISSDALSWLGAPDATINHNATCVKRNPGSGMWFIQSHTFQSWLTDSNSFIWLKGFAGCGKSVLCSTAILHAFRQRFRCNGTVGIGFFYFTFNDDSKQDDSAMLKTLILQLSAQLQDNQKDLIRLYMSYRLGVPSAQILLDYLQQMIRRFNHVYILIDALDESPRHPGDSQEHVLQALDSIRCWSISGLHLLVTSRDEYAIRIGLDALESQQVLLRNSEVDEDIARYISHRLSTDRKLEKWSKCREIITEALSKGARGVYVIHTQLDIFF